MECTVLDECHFGSSPELSRASIWLFARAAADICYEGFAEGELTSLLSLHWLERYLGAPPQMVETRYTSSSLPCSCLVFRCLSVFQMAGPDPRPSVIMIPI